ncbi:hypothetical protein, partial [Faecalibacillus faecis]|uniref:hypothetical protein n=1 Tax=Faecalibacillus faecis TaxID=1982628 RepID=UPI003868D964
MKDVKQTVESLIEYAKQHLELKADDEIYIKNRVLEVLIKSETEDLTEEEKDEIYGLLSLLPSEINAKFQRLLKENSKIATDWFYSYC